MSRRSVAFAITKYEDSAQERLALQKVEGERLESLQKRRNRLSAVVASEIGLAPSELADFIESLVVDVRGHLAAIGGPKVFSVTLPSNDDTEGKLKWVAHAIASSRSFIDGRHSEAASAGMLPGTYMIGLTNRGRATADRDAAMKAANDLKLALEAAVGLSETRQEGLRIAQDGLRESKKHFDQETRRQQAIDRLPIARATRDAAESLLEVQSGLVASASLRLTELQEKLSQRIEIDSKVQSSKEKVDAIASATSVLAAWRQSLEEVSQRRAELDPDAVRRALEEVAEIQSVLESAISGHADATASVERTQSRVGSIQRAVAVIAAELSTGPDMSSDRSSRLGDAAERDSSDECSCPVCQTSFSYSRLRELASQSAQAVSEDLAREQAKLTTAEVNLASARERKRRADASLAEVQSLDRAIRAADSRVHDAAVVAAREPWIARIAASGGQLLEAPVGEFLSQQGQIAEAELKDAVARSVATGVPTREEAERLVREAEAQVERSRASAADAQKSFRNHLKSCGVP